MTAERFVTCRAASYQDPVDAVAELRLADAEGGEYFFGGWAAERLPGEGEIYQGLFVAVHGDDSFPEGVAGQSGTRPI
ncbi:hypothetical protein [Nocardia sp. NPDC059239]|uniref:hypothetical protein n=1 Tax=Nocardia sp. NPDC059239 TaxID=3346785 RepID=UPI00368AD8DB